jgi:hypothetical protein
MEVVMSNICVITTGDECVHNYRQMGRYYGKSSKSYLSADFQCERCGKIRSFAVAMTGFWLEKAKTEGGAYV